jgi:prefoldin subunit 4
VGEAFVHVPLSRAQKLLAADQKALDREVAQLQEDVDDCEKNMKELKVALYAKFGKAINLD